MHFRKIKQEDIERNLECVEQTTHSSGDDALADTSASWADNGALHWKVHAISVKLISSSVEEEVFVV